MKQKIIILIILVICFQQVISKIYAKVIINEIYTSETHDWVELYNTSTESAVLDNYRLQDKKSEGGVNTHPLEGKIDRNSYKVIDLSNSLNNSGDVVELILIGNSDQTLESIGYGENQSICVPTGNQSIGRYPDNSSQFTLLSSYTRESPNNSSQPANCAVSPTPSCTPTHTPTKTPTHTPVPTNAPTSIPTSTSSPTPTHKSVNSAIKTPTPTPKKNPKDINIEPSISQSSDSAAVLGLETDGQNSSGSKFILKPVTISLLLTGIGCALLSFVFIIQKVYKKRNEIAI